MSDPTDHEEFFPTEYNHEDIFRSQIYPQLQSVVNLCDEYDIPILVSVQFKSDGKKAALCTIGIIPPERSCSAMTSALKYLADVEELE